MLSLDDVIDVVEHESLIILIHVEVVRRERDWPVKEHIVVVDGGVIGDHRVCLLHQFVQLDPGFRQVRVVDRPDVAKVDLLEIAQVLHRVGLDDEQHLMLLKESIKPLGVLEPCQQRKSQRELVLGVHALAVRVLAEGRRPEDHFFEPVRVLNEPRQGIAANIELVVPGQARADHLVLRERVLVHVVGHKERGLADHIAAVQRAAAPVNFHVLELGAVVEIDIELALGRVERGEGSVAGDGRLRPVDPGVQFHPVDGIRGVPLDKRHIFDPDIPELLRVVHDPGQLVLAVEALLQEVPVQRIRVAGHVRVALQHDLIVHGEQGRRRVGDQPFEFN